MRLLHDPVREHFLKPIIAVEPYVEDLITAVPSVVGEGFDTVADLRLSMQQRTFGWGVSYTKWLGRVSAKYGDDPENKPMIVLLTGGMLVSFLPFGFMTMGSYFHPVTAAVAAPLDAWNIYKYFS